MGAANAAGTRDAAFMRRALELAVRGSWPDPNPRVGCVIVDASGELVGEGWHRGAGTPHGEAAALAVAGDRARGATAYVSLEPCAHTGRTGPCADALVAAGVCRVVYGQDDPNGDAAGGADVLRAAGVEVVAGVLADEAAALNERWARTIALGRPLVTWKFAATLDGRSAAADGTSQWITSEEARADVHALRASRATRSSRAREPSSSTIPASPCARDQFVCRWARSPADSRFASWSGCETCPPRRRVHEGPGEVLAHPQP